jgi:Holliday junction resolvase
MLERKFQSKLIKQFTDEGWYVVKIITCNKNGFPDLLLLKGKEFRLVEVKGVKGELSKLQEYRIKELSELNINVEVIKLTRNNEF